ncbi:MAG: aminopeptidase P family protein [Candidatus Nitrosopelagicus sp.]|nr:aminopeptidase P family protein [Candidatus Nitrosopelagicus sp.]
MKARRKRLEKHCNSVNCDTLVTFEPENLFYLTGFWGEAVGILEKGGQTTIIAPELEAGRAKDESINCDVITSQRGGLISTLASLKKKKICVDCHNYSVMQSLKKSIPRLKRSSEPFYNARIIKDSDEVHILKKASSIIDQMFELCTQTIKKGRSESDLQAILMSFAIANDMHDTGYRSTLNPLIIAGGPNGALPHAQVTKRKFANGDMIVVDLTLRYKGYVSDATRTFGLGSISKEARTVYEIVKESQRAGLAVVRPQKTCKSVDEICRKIIEKHHYGPHFIHSTGHGIGLDVHESPNITSKSTTKLKKDMAVTVEPGIYIPNKFGVRIEDSVIVRDRPIIMHKFTKDLIVI